jgi:hypothetical protein
MKKGEDPPRLVKVLSSCELRAAADNSALLDRGQRKALLGAPGFEHAKVVFEEPPKT